MFSCALNKLLQYCFCICLLKTWTWLVGKFKVGEPGRPMASCFLGMLICKLYIELGIGIFWGCHIVGLTLIGFHVSKSCLVLKFISLF